ncbi:hypothetical protein [Undibacterium sp. Di24W]|uniref:hypothetical protein n=1 Tax=Undibacterium sp. Di24W TaxID=3413033 RepID=UPI003BF3796D
MENSLELSKAAQQKAISKIFCKLDEMLEDTAFATAYRDHPISCIAVENERLFGASFLESTALFYTCSAYHATTKQSAEAPVLLNQGFAHYLLAFQIYLADLRYVNVHKIENFVEGEDLCLLGFARAISYGFENVSDWWAEQLFFVRANNPDYLNQSMLDMNLLNHLLLLHTCWYEKRWCEPEEVTSDLGPYQALWKSVQDEKLRRSALGDCASYHLIEALNNDYSPFGSMPYGPYPVELIAWKKLYKRCFASECELPSHPLFDNAVVNAIGSARLYKDQFLNELQSKVRLFYGTCWSSPDKDS